MFKLLHNSTHFTCYQSNAQNSPSQSSTVCEPRPRCSSWIKKGRGTKDQIANIYSVQLSCSVMSDSSRTHRQQKARPFCPSPALKVYSNSCPLSRWWHPTISSSVIPFSSHRQSFPVLGSFPMSQFFTSGGQLHISWSFSFNFSSSNEYSGLISIRMDWLDLLAVQGTLNSPRVQDNQESKTLFSNTTVQKHQFFSTQLSL